MASPITPSVNRALAITPGSRVLRTPISDEAIWTRLKAAGFDEESIKNIDKAALVAYIAKLEAEKALGVEKECTASLEKALHEMRAEAAEAKVAADCKLVEARAMIEDAEKKSVEAEAKMRSAESLQTEASRFQRLAERKLKEVEEREEDISRRIVSFKAECDAKENQISLERQSLSEQLNSLQQEQERLLDAQALLNQREDYIFSRSEELKRLEKEVEVSRENFEKEQKVLKDERSKLDSDLASLLKREEAIAAREASLDEKDGKPLTFTEQFMLTHVKKGAQYDPTIPASEAPVVDLLKPLLRVYWDVGARLFGSDDRTWPEDWQEQILANMEDLVYKGNVPGFAYLRPADVRVPRRRGRDAGMSIGVGPTAYVATQSDLEKVLERNAAFSDLVTKLLAKQGATPLDPNQERLVKLNEEVQADWMMRRDLQTLREAEAKARWDEDNRWRAYFTSTHRRVSSSQFGGRVPGGDYRPTFDVVAESPPSMFDPTHISGTPQRTGYREEEEDDSETDD